MIIEKYIARIECENDNGTGFLVQGKLVLTALHNVSKYQGDLNNILITFPYSDFPKKEICARVIDKDDNLDIALLELDIDLKYDTYLEISTLKTAENDTWKTFGFPISKWTAGSRLSGYVLRSNIENDELLWDTDLYYEQNIERFDGFSGSPLIIRDCIKGIIVQQLDGSIAAISMSKIKGFLDKNNIIYVSLSNGSDVDSKSSKSSDELVRNNAVVMELEKNIFEQEKGYILLKGSPGSGKSTIINEYVSQTSNIKVIGKYLIRNKQEGVPTSVKASEPVFAEWLENVLWNELYGGIAPKKERQSHEWILEIHKLFIALSNQYIQSGTKGIIFIDGIEDVYILNKITEFFSLLPEELPRNILIVISCQNEEVLPLPYRVQIQEMKIIKVVPLSLKDVRYIVFNRLYDKNLSVKIKEAIVDKSEGHPLYLRYLIEEAIQLKEEKDIEQWLNKVPSIEGEIKFYYESLWQRIQELPNELYVLATIARLREGLAKETLMKILPNNVRGMLVLILPKLNHLLDIGDNMSIYHASFADFIIEKTSMLSDDIHYQITQFCKEYDENLYSIKNILFHMLRQSEKFRTEVVTYCNQNWIDKCTIHHIEPDLIVSDLNEVINFALSYKIEIKDTIRLLLLAQRIKFRYDNLFARYAAEIASLLIQKKQFDKAICYIVRQNFLIIPDEMALDFLYKFLKNSAFKEAQEIFNIFRQRLTLAMESGVIAYKDMRFYFNALTMISSYKSNNPEYEFSRKYKFLIDQSKYLPDEEEEQYAEFCLWLVAYHRAFLIFHRNEYKSIKFYEEQGLPINNRTIMMLVYILIELSQLEETYNEKINSDGKVKLLADIKYVFEKISVDMDNNEKILAALTDNIFKVDIIESLIKDIHTKDDTLVIREENGVDLNYQSIHKFKLFWCYQGFINREDKCPDLINGDRTRWEEYLERIISFIGYVKGRAWRERCEKTDTDLNVLADTVQSNLLSVLNLKLKERATWERSYFLVEDALAYIYEEIAKFYQEYCPERVQDFLDFIKGNLDKQLGMYTEGFRGTLFTVIGILKEIPGTRRKVYDISKGLEKHILMGVQNRWERTEDLISLATIYAYLENEGSTDRVFQELLNTSMGPSWYKEDQLSLIKSCLVNLQHANELEFYLEDLASILEHASGEMTFQRYVRVQKEEFIGSLCKIGHLSNAIKFLKEETLPSPRIIQEKVESSQIDYVDTGKGYKFGIGNLEVQNAILEILENIEDIHPILKWGFCELFLIGDTRYLNRFASIMAEIICESDAKKNGRLQMFFDRLLKIFLADMTQKERDEYLIFLKAELPQEIFNDLEELMIKNNIKIEAGIHNTNTKVTDTTSVQKTTKEERDELFLPGTFGKSASIDEAHGIFCEAIDEMQMDNFKIAKEKFIGGLKKLQDGGWQIWAREISPEANQAFNSLADICDKQEFVILLKNLIVHEEYAQDWQIVNKLLELIGNRLTGTEATEILKIIIEHLKLMVRPPQELKEYYQWLNNREASNPVNIELAQLFIWYLDSPMISIKYRGPEILKGLTRVDPNFFIPIILDYCFKLDGKAASEICAGIIYSLALEDIDLIWLYINQEYNINRIRECKHFSIKYTLMKTLEIGGIDPAAVDCSSGSSTEILYTGTNEEYWRNLHTLFSSLEKINCWDKNDYAKLQKYILDNNQGMEIDDLIKADNYLALAYRKQMPSELLNEEIYNAINQVLVNRVHGVNALKIFNILNRVNPVFPAEKIRLNSRPSLQKAIEQFISGKSNPESFLTHEEYEHLHYIEIIYSPEEKCMKSIEITAFLTNKENIFNEGFDFQQIAMEFKANNLPDFTQKEGERTLAHKPIICKAKLDNTYYGGIFTPAYFNRNLGLSIEVNEKDIIRENWLEGRSWEFGKIGMPLREGSRLLLSTEKINSFEDRGWRLLWLVNYDQDNAIIIDRKKKQIVRLW
ncbi:S1 family peptidase [Bacillus cereus]|uniref:S1 family peptidase n=1 Tax=Bacillus cereus TaxID=1396 RepID=UPI000B4BF0E5|nr:serine protease [Bacillus cereus]